MNKEKYKQITEKYIEKFAVKYPQKKEELAKLKEEIFREIDNSTNTLELAMSLRRLNGIAKQLRNK